METTTVAGTSTKTLGNSDWKDPLDARAVDTVRTLAMDAVEKAGSGHPGTAMSLAPLAYLLYQDYLRHDPTDPEWIGRDRIVLSCGHSSLTLYIQLYLSGYGLSLDDLESLRTWGSRTPGHPEHGHTPGIEVTTGPLGQGVGNAVGMAMATRRERGLFDPDAAPGTSPFDHHIYCIASDGDMEEGISGEASSLAATQRLGNLTLIYDENHISIEDDTDIAFSEDVAARYEAYGWHVQRVDWLADDGSYTEKIGDLRKALDKAARVTDRPSFIALRTIIGWPAPTKQNTGSAHGSALGPDEVAATKKVLGMNPDATFAVDPEVLAHARKVADRGRAAHAEWQQAYAAWADKNPERNALLERLSRHELPAGWDADLPVYQAGTSVASRNASQDFLTAAAPRLPELWGGSADLAGSNNTTPKGEPSFLPEDRQTKEFTGGPYGRVLHFGIREHAMGAVLNGIALHGGTRPYGGTFLTFSDYMRPSVRLAAMMKLPVTYVWTHDSIGLGGDGPTHQPIEQLAALRAIPDLDVVRPADGNETIVAWRTILGHTDRPAGLVLSRQKLPTVDRSTHASAELVARGAYVLAEAGEGIPQVLLIATGSEVALALAARDTLEAEGTPTRVVSMPCREWFAAEDQAYRDEVLPPNTRARVVVEAATPFGWEGVAGDAGEIVGIDHYGSSADGDVLFEQYGFTPDRVVAAAHASLQRAGA
ncbi:MAG TPA: transketolase [Mycobacteriales bacterium]